MLESLLIFFFKFKVCMSIKFIIKLILIFMNKNLYFKYTIMVKAVYLINEFCEKPDFVACEQKVRSSLTIMPSCTVCSAPCYLPSRKYNTVKPVLIGHSKTDKT